MGGSEIILGNLRRAFPEYFPDLNDSSKDLIQVVVSRPQATTLDATKPKLLWLQDLPGDPNSHVLADPSYRSKFNRIICVSHWQQQQYQAVLKIPYADMMVIKNAVPSLNPTLPKPKVDGKLRFIYTSTPHRGLTVLAACADALAQARQDWELHIYSSLKTYGWNEQDKQFEPLYAQLQKNPHVIYHGSQPNDVVRRAVLDAHVFVYPSIYMETSCMAIQEAMMAGCLAITTNLAALPETCAEWAWMFPVDENPEKIAEKTLAAMHQALTTYDNERVQQILKMQTIYYQTFWSFEGRLPMWKAVLDAVAQEGPTSEMLVIE